MIKMSESLSKQIFVYLPECAVKDYIRRVYWQKRLSLLRTYSTKGPNELFIVLDNGLKFVGDRSILGMLCDQSVKNFYGRYFKADQESVIIDAGAHQGTFTVSMASSAKVGHVIAIEPMSANLMFLKKNLRINNLENVTVIPKGLWSNSRKRTFYLGSSSAEYSILRDRKLTALKIVEIEVDTLDNILEQHGVNKVDFIKMNIEGAEIEALKGARRTLKNHPVELVIDAHHFVNGKPTYETIIPMLKELGFKCEGKSLIYAFPNR